MDSLNPKKRFGQNFLTDEGTVDRIIDLVQPTESDHIFEIGPGTGALTGRLIDSGAIVHAVEIDKRLCSFLTSRFSSHQTFFLKSGDFLKFELSELRKQSISWKVVGNLPYNLATPMVLHLLNSRSLFSKLVLMTQLEVAERMVAAPNTPNYGRLSIAIQRKTQVHLRYQVENTCFYPKPKVTSALVEIKPTFLENQGYLESQLDTITRSAFGNRRKTITNSLREFFSKNDILSCGLDPKSRAENLSIEDYEKLARHKNEHL